MFLKDMNWSPPAFVTALPCLHSHSRSSSGTARCRTQRLSRTVVAAKGSQAPPPSGGKQSLNASTNSSPFSGFSAGPSASGSKAPSKRKLSTPRTPQTEAAEIEPPEEELPATANETVELDSSEKSVVSEAATVVRALGTTKVEKKESVFERKTAADFIAEGIVDDVDDDDDESLPLADIRFGIDDVKDPFKEDLQRDEQVMVQIEQQKIQDSIGVEQDVTGDAGVSKVLISPGVGEIVPGASKVSVHYTGRLENGNVFDSSRKRDEPFSFDLGSGTVIKGWEAGVASMRVGEKAEFSIQPNYAYGRRGMPPVIPGNAVLIFEIELLSAEGGETDSIRSVPEFNSEISRTPEEIARDYEERLKTQEERKKNLSLFERFYFISPFMSQTGEKPPWWINPNITFVIIALCTAVGFYLVILSGAIHVGYVDQPVDVNIFK